MTEPTTLPQLIADRFLDFSLTVEWELKNDIIPTGYFKFLFPTYFPLSCQQQMGLPVLEEQSAETVTVNCCIDDFFVDSIFRNPFTFQLLYSKEMLDQQPEMFIPERFQLDGSPLFLPEVTETSITFEDIGIFQKLTFSMYCESQLLNEECFKAFAPAFIHIWKMTNMPNSPSDSIPTYFTCNVKNKEHYILSHGLDIDCVIPIEYREQTDITFCIRNHEKIYPSNANFYGSGIINSNLTNNIALNGEKSLAFGTTTFDFLPERRKRSRLLHSLNEPSADFSINSCDLSYHIFDPSNEQDPIPEDRGPISRPAIEKVKPEDEELGEGDQAILNLEKKSTKLIRWAFTCTRSDGTWNYATKIIDYVKKFHANGVKSGEIPNSFQGYYRRKKDVITGLHIMTPTEQIIILETRGQEPMISAKGLEQILRSFGNGAHVIANKSLFFHPPRLYCLCENLIQRVSVPLSMKDLLRIDGLYFPKSPNYKYYPILTKLSHIMECNTLREMEDGSLFPSYQEVVFLIQKASSFYTIPFQKGMPPAVVSSARRADFGDSRRTSKIDERNNDVDENYENDQNDQKNRTITAANALPDSLIFISSKRSLSSKSIVTPIDRLTNYSLQMTQNQRQTFKTRHARLEKLRREEEWLNAVERFTQTQEKMAQTLKWTSDSMWSPTVNGMPVAIVPPCNAQNSLSPRTLYSRRSNQYSPRHSFNSRIAAQRLSESARGIKIPPFENVEK